jgi:hypothetical protein
MPIKGLTDRGLSFPEIGQIRKGTKEERKREDGSSYEIPVDLKYFRVKFDQKEVESEQRFRQIYGMEPQEINIILPFNEIEKCWEAWLEGYTKGRLVARSDGEKFIWLVDTDTGAVKVRNGQPYLEYQEGKPVGKDFEGKPVYCKPVGRLTIIVPELERAAYMTLSTTSIHDIANISSQLEAFKRINHGVIKGIPLVLRRRPKKISIPNPKKKGQKIRMEKWLLSIEADPAWVRAKLMEVKTLALPGEEFEKLASGALPANGEELEMGEIPEYLAGEIVEEEVEEINLEQAVEVVTSEGVKYGDIESEVLTSMWGSIQEKINHIANTGENIEHLGELAEKRDAIQVILNSRQESE